MSILEPQAPGIPLPQPTPLTEQFWKGCARHELRYQRCCQCGQAQFNPVYLCRSCLSTELEWCTGTGQGEVYSWTVAWRSPVPEFRVPYVPVIVRLVEGYDMVSNLIGCPVDDVKVGLPVEAAFREVGDGVVLPYFKPRGSRD